MKFWANGFGLKGGYNAGESPVFEQYVRPPESNNQRALNVHKSLIQKLVTAGWESTGGCGAAW